MVDEGSRPSEVVRPTVEFPVIAGVIEGFYGTPWSHADRLNCIDVLHRHGGNSYVWAGKSEPRHRDAWDQPFTDDELTSFGELATHRVGVDLIVGLTPGSDASTSDVVRKLQPAMKVGALGVALLFDDLPVLDAAIRHRSLANDVEQRLGCSVWLTPTHYAGTGESPYLQQLMSDLSPSIEVMWTGEHVVSDRIDADQARQRAHVCRGRRPLLWDNTPVNDAMMSEALHLGPYSGRETALRAEISGVLLNPMMFARASLPTIVSAMAWCRGDDPMSAWRDDIDERGWRLLAESTAFPDDPHWPGARPDRDWWNAVAHMDISDIDPGCTAWVVAAREGARLAVSAWDIHDEPVDDVQRHAMRVIGLTLAWRTWRREPVLTFGGGPRLRPVLTNDSEGKFAYDERSVSFTTSLVDDLVRRATR